jgi:5-methylcytosine-specific restriction endonuclease McrA
MSNKKKKGKWKKKIKQEQDYICPVCGKKGTTRNMNIHHKIAKSHNGTSARNNVVAWHISCHENYHRTWGNQTSDDYGNPIRPRKH